MSCEGKDLNIISIEQLQDALIKHRQRYQDAQANTSNEPLPISQARAIVELKQARLLIAKIGQRDPEDYDK